MAWRDRPVVVTGGMGFIGSNLVLHLTRLGAAVTVVDRMLAQYGANPFNLSNAPKNLTLIEADIGAEAAIEAAVRDAAVIFNLAGQTSHMDSMQQPLEDLRLNQEANLRFLELIRRVNPQARLVFSSTRQFYGLPQYLPVDEKHPIAPPDINGVHKFAAETYHLLYARIYGLRATALRLTNVYGPRMRIRDAKQTFLGVWIRHVIENSRFEVWGGTQKRDFTFVDDLVSALIAAAEQDATIGQAYNVGGCPPVSLKDLADMLIRVAGQGRYDLLEFPAERKKIDIGDYVADDRAFRAATGWQPKTSLEDGLAATVAYYRQHASHYL
ncbi:NAD-dependent epimerase/dehydratase family protein [uncultured Ferrovibrio sp.]|mgnify:FL=1|jgi:Nucleoside-diphosphate-sugar epimerases|uniref:NAD-dependent epimerase/dehydratase family protein n=1 Tax=uncultured Ferrovibrio sp. TaxID=1576913 RepID=UPI002619AA13|nr:NAD-dependent epimerase/dehydratase family protein [uncultured Ferrovibrio sp.]